MTTPPLPLPEADQPETDQSLSVGAVSGPVSTSTEQGRFVIPPTPGEIIVSGLTGNTYTMEGPIGEGSFGVVYGCVDDWNNKLAAKILKPINTYDQVKASAYAEMVRLIELRHPQITHFYDAFEYRDTFYIITERCISSVAQFLSSDWFNGPLWTLAIARSLLQAVQFLHNNQYAHQDIHAGNVFALFARNELNPGDRSATQFRLGDLGVAKVFSEINAKNTRANWMLPPEVLNQSEFGAPDRRVDIYHTGLLLLQVEHSKEIQFTKEELLAGKPREMALQLRAPFNFALEKALRRHVSKRTETARELWQDLNSSLSTSNVISSEVASGESELPFPLLGQGAPSAESESNT